MADSSAAAVLVAAEEIEPPELLTVDTGDSCASRAAACAEIDEPDDVAEPVVVEGASPDAAEPDAAESDEPPLVAEPFVESPLSSAWAGHEPPISAAPTPTVTTPAPNH